MLSQSHYIVFLGFHLILKHSMTFRCITASQVILKHGNGAVLCVKVGFAAGI